MAHRVYMQWYTRHQEKGREAFVFRSRVSLTALNLLGSQPSKRRCWEWPDGLAVTVLGSMIHPYPNPLPARKVGITLPTTTYSFE